LTILVLAGSGLAQQQEVEPSVPPAANPAPPPQPADQVTPSEQPAAEQAPAETAPPPATPETTVAVPAEKDEFGYLVCYREKRFVGAALNTSVYVDDIEIADMDNGCYIIVKVKPGEHNLHADEKKDAFTVKVEAGKVYYYRMELTWGIWKGHGRLKEVDLAEGEKEFKEWNLEFAPDVRQPEMVVREVQK
jgi:hypothetical protein